MSSEANALCGLSGFPSNIYLHDCSPVVVEARNLKWGCWSGHTASDGFRGGSGSGKPAYLFSFWDLQGSWEDNSDFCLCHLITFPSSGENALSPPFKSSSHWISVPPASMMRFQERWLPLVKVLSPNTVPLIGSRWISLLGDTIRPTRALDHCLRPCFGRNPNENFPVCKINWDCFSITRSPTSRCRSPNPSFLSGGCSLYLEIFFLPQSKFGFYPNWNE